MKMIVLTSNKYTFLLEGYAQLFNKHWKGTPEVTILGYDEPLCKLPENFKFHSLGKQGIFWSDPLISFFSNLEDEYFFFCFEDHFLIKDVDLGVLAESVNLLKHNDDVDKVWLLCKPTIKGIDYSKNFFKWVKTKGCLIPTSLLPSIWKKDYFLRLLKPKMSCWDFEVNNPLSSNVIYPRSWPIYPSVDAMRGGQFNDTVFSNWNNNKTVGPQVWQKDVDVDDINVFRNMREG